MEENSTILVADDLNEDCMLEIFSYLSINDMMQVKNVCRKWRQISQQWFKQVQTVKFVTQRPEIWKWKLHAKYFKRELGSGTDIKKLIPILKLFGHHIKHYYLECYDTPRNKECDNLLFKLFPKLCKNIVDANFFSLSYPIGIINTISKHWRQLEKFKFNNFSSFFHKNLCDLLNNNQQLKIFSLRYERHGFTTDEFFTYLPTKIKTIDIEFQTNKKNKLKYFVSTIKNFTSLSSLRLSQLFFLSDAAGAAIGELKSLKHLILSDIDSYESRRTIDPIANLENLKSIQLIDNNDLKEDNLINIVNNCKKLEQLSIYSEILTDKGMMEISKLERLKILAIRAGSVSSKSIINLCDNLEVFLCEDSKMNNDDAIKLLEKATKLWFVEFTDCFNLTKDVIEAGKKIGNGRKKNILHMVLYDESIDFDDVETPYFRCQDYSEVLPLKLLPNYIKVYLGEHYPRE